MITVFCSDLEDFKKLPYNMLDTADVLYIDGTVVKSPTMPLRFQELVNAPSPSTVQPLEALSKRVVDLERNVQNLCNYIVHNSRTGPLEGK